PPGLWPVAQRRRPLRPPPSRRAAPRPQGGAGARPARLTQKGLQPGVWCHRMNRRERDLLLREAHAWAADGTIPPESLAVIEARLASAETMERPGAGVLALHGAGGALLGAGAIALVELLKLTDQAAGWTLLACGLALAAAGLLLAHLARLREP